MKVNHMRYRRLLENAPAPLREAARRDADCARWLEALMLSEEVLRGFTETSSEAMWCIEFSEPVDLSQNEREIVRQVFENDCHWLLCNEVLVRLYGLPSGLDIERQPVAQYFPRSPENEAFILQIVRSGYAVDRAASVDLRHDGSARYMENDVRCRIVDGFLMRMWGVLRDVTDSCRARERLKNEAETVSSILSALPDAILVIDRDRRLVAVNSSFETLLGWSGENFFGHDVQCIIDLERTLPGRCRGCGFCHLRWQTTVRTKFDTSLPCEAQIAPIGEDIPHHFVLSLRPLLEPSRRGAKGHAARNRP
jgi:PAS domain S-box-containing protein